jgi:tetratricopeptide (TPR) repeat protein
MLAACVPLAAWPCSARAQATPPELRPETRPPPADALAHYNRGREHYQAGRYRDALLELEVAVNLDPSSPNLVFNVARIYELLGEIDHAIAFYRRYLEMLPANELEERERTSLTLQRLEGARTHVVEEPTKAPPVVRERGVADAAFWTVAGIGALTLAGAAVTGALALTTERDSEQFRLGEDGSNAARQRLVDRSERFALACDTMLLAGVSLGVTAILLYALREKPVASARSADTKVDLDVRAWQDGAMIGLRGSL